VGLAASTYLVLGRIGLVLIGAVGGVVLHATWESQNDASGDQDGAQERQQRRKKELGLEVALRALEWRGKRQLQRDPGDREKDAFEDVASQERTINYADFQPETRIALNEFTDAVVRDYVRWWYSPLLPKEQTFPEACRQTLATFIVSFSNRLSRKRTADPVLDFMANSTSIMIVFLTELGMALKASQNQDAAVAIRTYLQYQPESNLANVINPSQQERKLNIIADDILQNFLDKQSYNCAPVKSFLREVLSGLILQPTVEMCSKPEWINGWIVYLLEEGEPEIMNVIDAGVEDMTGQGSDRTVAQEHAKHQRRKSKAEEAMQQAMQEVERMNAMIAEEEAKQHQEARADTDDTTSNTTTETGVGAATPTSSESDRSIAEQPTRTSFVFDSEGNAIPSANVSPVRKSRPIALDGTAENIEGPSTTMDGSVEIPMGAEHRSSTRDSGPPQTFDDIGVNNAPEPELTTVMIPAPLTLQHAFITLLDLGEGDDRAALKKEPKDDLYMIQIEPASSKFPGWMVTRGYTDFVKIHPTLLTIAKISGVPEFSHQYPELPSWRGVMRSSFRGGLEYYLRDALKYERLAESDTMKKFLDKEVGISKAPTQPKNVFVQGGAALENVGKNFVNVLGQGGKGIAGGGKAVFGGVQGAFGTITSGIAKKPSTPQRPTHTLSRNSTGLTASGSNLDAPRPSSDLGSDAKGDVRPSHSGKMSMDQSLRSGSSSVAATPPSMSQESLHLPPPPDAISDEYVPVKPMSVGTPSKEIVPTWKEAPTTPTSSQFPASESPSASRASLPPEPRRQQAPITEEETRVIIDLMFAIITELYSLSSAWTIRMSLLSAAKTYLLRPQNPQLESIRTLLQESVLDANFSDAGMATHIRKLRENAAPTDEERAKWPAELTADEKENLRLKARRLLVERGMPQALTSVMGAAASGEALGRIFDCLQIEEISKGLIFALLLQAIRAMTQ
jgi:hypothetical protein